jgi:hypothetical protein
MELKKTILERIDKIYDNIDEIVCEGCPTRYYNTFDKIVFNFEKIQASLEEFCKEGEHVQDN